MNSGALTIDGVLEHKLFVGMVPKAATDEDLRALFAPFGTIEECVILRSPTDNTSKGARVFKFCICILYLSLSLFFFFFFSSYCISQRLFLNS
jgi:RNA recognition motif-containing protein